MLNNPFLKSICLSSVLMVSVSGFSQQLQQSSTAAYQEGINLYKNGLYEEAEQHLITFLRKNSDRKLNSAAGFFLARSRTASDSANIEYYYLDFINRYPGSEFSVVLLRDLAHRFTDTGQYKEAIFYYQEALNFGMRPDEASQTYYWMAEASVAKEDYESAHQYYQQIPDKFPDSDWAPKALYARGRLYLANNRFNEATQVFEVLKSEYPRAPITRKVGTALGESYYQQGKYPEAIEALQNALPDLDPESRSKAVLLIAESHNFLDNYDRASTFYLQYINLNKGTDKERAAHYGLGWLYHKQEIYHWAAESFAKASNGNDILARKAQYYKAVNEKLGNQYAKSMESFRTFGERFKEGMWIEEAYYEWAVSAFEAGFYGEAIEVLLRLVRSDTEMKNPGKVFTLLGESYFANNEFSRAIEAFEQAEKSTDLDPAVKLQARFQKAWVQFRNQAYEQSQPIFEQVYRDSPNSEIGKEALFWSADAHYKLNQYGRASNQFAEFIRIAPGHELMGAAHYSLGWSYFEMGDYEKAVGPLQKFLDQYEAPPVALFPYDTDTQLRIGDAYYAMGNYRKAIEFYNMAIGAEPGGDYAMFQVANSYYRANRTFEAVSTFRRLLRIYPFSRLREQAQYNIAYIYLNTSNYSQAIEEFQKVIEKYPGTSWAARSLYNIGDAYYNAGEYDRAIQTYKNVLEEYPRGEYIIEAINGIQYAQLSAGKADSSSQILEEFLSENPRSSTADQLRYRQAENLMQSGDYEGAIRAFRQYLRVTNSDNLVPDAYANLAEAYLQMGREDLAIQTYQTIIDEFPDDDQAPPALVALGNLNLEEGNFERSHQIFEQLFRTAPRFRQEAYIGMANASLQSGDFEAAQTEFQEVLNINPANDAAKVGLAKIDIENKNYSDASDRLALVAETNTTAIGAEAQYYLGRAKQLNGEFEAAIEEFSKVKVLYEAFDEWVSMAQYHSAVCHIRLGNRGEAMGILNSVIENYPGTEAAEKAQVILASGGS